MSNVLKKLEDIKENIKKPHLAVAPTTTSEIKTRLSPEKRKLIITATSIVLVIIAISTISYFRAKQNEAKLIRTEAPKGITLDDANVEVTKLIRNKDYKSALHYIETFTGGVPAHNISINNIRAISLRKTGKVKEAVTLYQSLLAIMPDNAELHNNLGTAYLELKEDDKALIEFIKATSLSTDYAEGYLNLGITYERMKKWGGAMEAYQSFLRSKDVMPGTVEMIKKRMIRLAPMVSFEDKKTKKM